MLNNQALEMVGTFSDFSCKISQDDKNVFEKAMNGFVGVKYTPVAVATQVVQGTNYAFFCNGEGAYPESISQPSIVYIYQDLNGAVELKRIQAL